MSKNTDSTKPETALCKWYKSLLGKSDYLRDSVCTKCYKLLISAGVAEEKIFNREKLKRRFLF